MQGLENKRSMRRRKLLNITWLQVTSLRLDNHKPLLPDRWIYSAYVPLWLICFIIFLILAFYLIH